jgi:hypothetical protein
MVYAECVKLKVRNYKTMRVEPENYRALAKVKRERLPRMSLSAIGNTAIEAGLKVLEMGTKK